MAQIEGFGNTALSFDGSKYTLSSVGATLSYGGSAVTLGQFGAWSPWSAELRTSTLDVVFKNVTANQFIVWTVDLSGNYLGQAAPLSATSYALQSLEVSFFHDLNGDNYIGPKPGAVIDNVGTYKLVERADGYAIAPTTVATGVMLKYAGAIVTSGQFAGWTPVGVAQTALGFQVAWKNAGTGQFQVWQTDSNGHYMWNDVGPTSGAAADFQVKETVFGQDLNGDGTIGLNTTTIESIGATTLAQVGNTFFLYDHGTTTGPQLTRGGDTVTANQYAGWTAIGAEKTTYGYEVAWANYGTGQFIVWATDADGNYVSDMIGPVSGSSDVLRAFEASFGQNLNGDASLSLGTPIDSLGTTKLTGNFGYYFLSQAGGLAGPALRFGGAFVTAGQFGGWKPIGAEKTANGYDVVWQNGTADQYTVWSVDNAGNWLSQGPTISGVALQARETTFSQDLNGDTTIGEVSAFGETDGATDLIQIGSGYFLYAAGTSTGPQLKYGAAAYAFGQFGGWAPIGAEKTTGGYQVAWKMAGADQYLVWATDANGNFLSQTAVMSGASSALKAFEPGFAQDLNGDAAPAALPATIEAQGTTILVQVLDRYFLNTVGGTWGPELSRGGAPVTAGQYGSWAPIGAEKTTSGYMVAWKDSASGQYIVWATDNGGNYLSDVTGPVAGSSTDLRVLEPAFAQNLNGDGGTETVALPAIESDGNTSLVQMIDRYFLNSTGGTWGPELRMGGAPVTAGQFAGWTPIQAEKNSAGYLVGWQNGSQFIFWTTDSSGNYQSDSGVVAGEYALRTYEVIFNKDLDADGMVAFDYTEESAGTTSLQLAGPNYVLKSADNAGVVLKYGGSALRPDQFVNWGPIAAEQTATGYHLVFKNNVAQLCVEWTTDSNGNFVSQSAAMSWGSTALQTLEVVYGQDLNGDAQIGLATTTIETAGATSLAKIGDGYFLGGSSGPLLKFGGTAVAPGQFGTWAPIAAEQTGNGYEVAWNNLGGDQYIVWLTDSSGNYLSQLGPESGATYDLQAVEWSFSQDLNHDGTVGVVSTPIETNGWSSLVKEANTYFLYETGSTNGPFLKFGGVPVTEGQFPGWTPAAVEKTATGYDVAWRTFGGPGDNYIVWTTDNDGNYLSSLVGPIASGAMTPFEPIFHQDFGDAGTAISSATTIEAVGSVSLLQLNGSYYIGQSGGSMMMPLLYGSGFAGFSGWSAFAATATATGYQVAWQHTDGVQKVVWNVDSTGHLVSPSASMFGQSSAFESYEPGFQQDLNGDGVIGVPAGNFNITLDFGSDGPSTEDMQYMSYFDAAVARWQQIIVGDLPSVTHFQEGLVDDIKIDVWIGPIDGEFGALGQGGPDAMRTSAPKLPWLGHLDVDAMDIARIAADGRLTYTIEHEIAHALGFNTTVWDSMGLRDGSGNYIGQHGLYAYRMLSGDQSATYVPTNGGHLLESVFGRELMTSTMTTSGDPISIVTIGILEDMGYKVNYSAADPYSLPPPGVSASVQSSSTQGSSNAVQGGEPVLTIPEDWLVH